MGLLAARRVREPVVVLLSLVLPVLAGAALAGCPRHPAGAPAPAATAEDTAQGAAYQSEAERTRAMEDKARELEKKAADIQNMQGTEQEKIDAVNKLEQERQDLNRTGGNGSASTPPPY